MDEPESQPPSFFLVDGPREGDADRPTRAPPSIYVMWHPAFKEGPALAHEIRLWFGGGTGDIQSAGVGIPVHFRSEPWRASDAVEDRDIPPPENIEAGAEGDRRKRLTDWRRPVDISTAQHNVFVPLVDDNMIDDPSWRRDLLELAGRHARGRDEQGRPKAGSDAPMVHLAPLQASTAWPRMPPSVTRIKALHLRRWDDKDRETDEERLTTWRRRARRLLTQALVRLLAVLRASSLPTEVFLSHAKADLQLGPGVAERLRDVAAGYGQIEVFYDENDLPSGGYFESIMLRSAGKGAGFIAVLGDQYASRYWCRREIRAARTPARVGEPGESSHSVWSVRPAVVAVTLAGGWSRLVGDLAMAPAVAWRSDDVEQGPAILDRLFREALIAEFQILYANMLIAKLQAALPAGKSVADLPIDFATWTPDVASVLRVYKAKERLPEDALLVYPGQGLLPTEEEDLEGMLDGVSFVSYEQFADLIGGVPNESLSWPTVLAAAKEKRKPAPPTGPRVALSAGDADNLAALGYDAHRANQSIHVDVAVLRLCRTLMEANGRIAYGGVLRESGGFTSLLHDLALAMFSSAPDDADPEAPLEAWVARPYSAHHPVERRASLAGLCRFYFVGSAVPSDASVRTRARITAQALSEMRREVARRTSLTLSLAGKRWGFDGVMPGIAEEVLSATEFTGTPCPTRRDVRVILLGEYGGVAREMVQYIIGRSRELPDSLRLEKQAAHAGGRVAALVSARDDTARWARQRYDDLRTCLDGLRDIATGDPDKELPRLGITVRDWKGLMTTSSIGHVRRVLRKHVIPSL